MNSQPVPAISRTLPDGTLIELVYDAAKGTTAFAVARPGEAPRIEPNVDLPDGTRLAPYSPENNLIATGCVLLPSALGEIGDVRDIVAAIRSYLDRYVALSDAFRILAPYYVLLSWSYDAFGDVPYLRAIGDYGTGKTRLLLALGAICYKPFFASGASTVSPIFHILDAFGGTLVLDEADFRFSDMTGELIKILNNGTVKGLPVLRTMTNRHKELNPTAFRVFGPKLIAMREPFADEALESRLITETMAHRPLSPHIPLHTPELMREEACALRNRLLAWRLSAFHNIRVRPERRVPSADPRTNQMLLPLLSLVEDEGERAQIAGWIAGARTTRPSVSAVIVAAARDAFAHTAGPYVPVRAIASRANARLAATGAPALSNKRVGAIIRKLGLPTAKSRGVYGIPSTERPRVATLAERLGAPRSDDARLAAATESPASTEGPRAASMDERH